MGLSRHVSRGEQRAFRSLYRDYYGFVWSTVQRFGVPSDAIDDAVQDAFMVVFRRWSEFPVDRQHAWLYGIARRVSANARKIAGRRARKHDALRQEHPQRVEITGRLEASTAIERFLRRLAPEDRELFVLGVVDGLTGKELSAALQVKPSTIHGRLQALRRRFRVEAGEEAEASARRCRQQRPRASAAGWAALLPKVGGPGAVMLVMGTVAAAVVALFVGTRSAEPPVAPGAPSSIVATGKEPRVAPTPSAVVTVTSAPELAHEMTPLRPVETASPVRRPTKEAKPDALQAEAALVRQIRQRVRAGEGKAALRLVSRHGRRHRDGVLADVVAALEVDALCLLGRRVDAEARAGALLRRRPQTPVAQRVSGGCMAARTATEEPSVFPARTATPGSGDTL